MLYIDAKLEEKILKMAQEGFSYAEIRRRTNLSRNDMLKILGRKKDSKKVVERKEKIKEMAKEGISCAEIGRRVGCSRQAIWSMLNAAGELPTKQPKKQPEKSSETIAKKQCVYPHIRKYMNENKICAKKLTIMIFGDDSSSFSYEYEKVRKTLRGENCKEDVIDGILKITGMTYEEAFFLQEG